MIDSKARHIFQPAFDRIGKGLVSMKISPNQITIVAFVLGLCVGPAVILNKLGIALMLLWISGFLDVLDGSVARLTGKSSKAGAFMDLIMDRMVEASLIIGFAISFPQYSFMYILFLTMVIFNFSTFMAAGALYQNTGNKSMHYDVGLIERTETFIFFSLMLIIPYYTNWILMVLNILILYTGLIRFNRFIKEAKLLDGNRTEN